MEKQRKKEMLDEKRRNAERVQFFNFYGNCNLQMNNFQTFEHWKKLFIETKQNQRLRLATAEKQRFDSTEKQNIIKNKEAERSFDAWYNLFFVIQNYF